jgi:hypothetical protein
MFLRKKVLRVADCRLGPLPFVANSSAGAWSSSLDYRDVRAVGGGAVVDGVGESYVEIARAAGEDVDPEVILAASHGGDVSKCGGKAKAKQILFEDDNKKSKEDRRGTRGIVIFTFVIEMKAYAVPQEAWQKESLRIYKHVNRTASHYSPGQQGTGYARHQEYRSSHP